VIVACKVEAYTLCSQFKIIQKVDDYRWKCGDQKGRAVSDPAFGLHLGGLQVNKAFRERSAKIFAAPIRNRRSLLLLCFSRICLSKEPKSKRCWEQFH